jgi:hypothetical protein|eukprot:COSAG01_NODE_1287_length_10887_cov_17.346924_5_plen_86_part_00
MPHGEMMRANAQMMRANAQMMMMRANAQVAGLGAAVDPALRRMVRVGGAWWGAGPAAAAAAGAGAAPGLFFPGHPHPARDEHEDY